MATKPSLAGAPSPKVIGAVLACWNDTPSVL